MSETTIYFLVILGFLSFIDIFTNSLFQHYYAKKCNYNCERCKNWQCMSNYCDRKRGDK